MELYTAFILGSFRFPVYNVDGHLQLTPAPWPPQTTEPDEAKAPGPPAPPP